MEKAAKRSYVTVSVARGLNFRSSPEKSNNIIKVLPVGKRLIVRDNVASPPGWLAIRYGNQNGFVMAEYVTQEG